MPKLTSLLQMQWEETQDNLKLTMARNVQGLHAPMRILMERKIVGFVRALSLLPFCHSCPLPIPVRSCYLDRP